MTEYLYLRQKFIYHESILYNIYVPISNFNMPIISAYYG